MAELHVFDTQNSQYVVRQICNSEDFKNLDLIIGPAFSKNIEIVSQEAKKYNIPIVSPSLMISFLRIMKMHLWSVHLKKYRMTNL